MRCERCDQVHDRCAAHRRDGQPCTQWPVTGIDKCRMHAGKAAKNVVANAVAERIVQREAGRLLDELAVSNKHPHEVLLEALDQAGTMVAALRLLVGGLDLRSEYHVHRGIGAPHYEITDPGLSGPKPTGEGAPHVLVVMYGEWLDRYTKIAKLALDAGIDERRTQLAEATAGRLFTAVDRAMTTLPVGQRDQFREALADELRALPTG